VAKDSSIADLGKKIDKVTTFLEGLSKSIDGISKQLNTSTKKQQALEKKVAATEKKQADLGKQILKVLGDIGAGAVKTAALPVSAGIAAWDWNAEQITKRLSGVLTELEGISKDLKQLSPKLQEAKQAFLSTDFQAIVNQLNATAKTLKTLNLVAAAGKASGLAKETMNVYSHLIDKLQRADAAIDEVIATLKRFPAQLKKDVQSKLDAAVKELVAFVKAIKQKIDKAISGLLKLVAALAALINKAMKALNVVQKAKQAVRRWNPFGRP